MFETPSIRIATPDDAAACTAIISASYETLWRGFYDEATLASVLPKIVGANPALLASGSYFIVHDGGAPAGCGGWSFDPPEKSDPRVPGIGHIRHYAVHPDHVRRGIGRLLFAACADQARAQGISTFVAQASLPAVPFYASLGFVEEEKGLLAIPGALALPLVRMRCALG